MRASWRRRFPGCEPVAHTMRRAFPNRWVRFHSLPGSQRYPDNEAEFATLLARHNLVLGSLTHAGETLALLTTGYSRTAEPVRDNDVLLAVDPDAVPWRTVAIHEHDTNFAERSFWHVFASRRPWFPGGFDPVVRLVAGGGLSNVMIVPLDCRWLLHPYDGGMDVILDTGAARDALAASFPEWLSGRADGL